jgi:hypothetical protein
MISLAVTLAVRVSLAILSRRHADMANKGTAQCIRIGKAALHGYLLRRFVTDFHNRRAADTRADSTPAAGVTPTSLWNSLAKWRGLRPARAARLAML